LRSSRSAGSTRHPDRQDVPLDQVVEAHSHLESNQQIGKVVVSV
jgi:NADPH:quinone reductase-like Zn-dependent oxidoreductase